MAETTMVPIQSGESKPRRPEPFTFLDDLEADMERFWRRPWLGFLQTPRRTPMPAGSAWSPRMDVYEQENIIVVKTELPGLKKENVQVEVDGEYLVIHGESKEESEVNEANYYRSERNFGSFYRRMRLPVGVTAEQIQANLTDGVLEVRVPRPVEASTATQKVEVK
jgi:HSP20 family protein